MAGFDASGEAGGTGLSKHIRALGISETYDLAGFGEAQASVNGACVCVRCTEHHDSGLVCPVRLISS